MGVVVPAAGRGIRFGSTRNKIWTEIAGKPVLEWTLSAFQEHPDVDTIIVCASAEDRPQIEETVRTFSKVTCVCSGGATRQASVHNGISHLPESCGIILVHDAARPAISADVISRVIEAIRERGAAVPGLPVHDTLKRADSTGTVQATVDRDGLWSVQTPQGARAADLKAAYQAAEESGTSATDEAGVLEASGYPVTIVEGDEDNIKVTRKSDVAQAEQILSRRGTTLLPRTGFGYDVHRFAEDRELWLGGVNIPHTRGLLGHSDADVMLHALCDALLGAVGLGDIGVLFPDTDMAHKDRRSVEFVQEVVLRLQQHGWRPYQVDITLLAEEPRIGKYRATMVGTIASILQVSTDDVNIKATTSEGMGFVGRREGMACWAVASVVPL